MTRTLSSRQAEERLQRLVDVVRALHRAPDGDAVASGSATAIMPLGSMYSCSCAPVSYSPSTIDRGVCANAASTSPFSTRKRLEDVVVAPDDVRAGERVLDGEDAGQRLDVDRDGAARLLEQVAVGMREQHDRLFGMIDDARAARHGWSSRISATRLRPRDVGGA